MDDDTLAAAVATLAAHVHAATWRLLVLIAELDRRKLWAAQGAMSCAHWLGWACGIDAHTAREKVRVARALEGLPLLSGALSKVELGYSKVRALTRVATADNEALGLAIDGRTATARWDGQPVDYDQAVMVAMASWEPCGTGSEAAATPANASPP